MDECASRESNYVVETESCEYGKSFYLTNEIFTSFETLLNPSFYLKTQNLHLFINKPMFYIYLSVLCGL